MYMQWQKINNKYTFFTEYSETKVSLHLKKL